MTVTPNLGMTLLEPSDLSVRERLNTALTIIDTNALPVAHALTNAHFKLWTPSTNYSLKDVIRTTAIPLWGVWRCTTAGTSGITEPTGTIEGTVFTDGTVVWKLAAIGADAIRIHNDLLGRGAIDAHPTSAITGLDALLENTIGKDDYTDSGIILYPTVTDNGDGSITFTGGRYNFYTDPEATLPLMAYTGINQTISLNNNSTNYICARLTGASPNIVMEYYLADRININYQNTLPVLTGFRQGNFISKLVWGKTATGTATRILKKMNRTSRFTRESGLVLSESAGRLVQIGTGIVWFSITSIDLVSVISSTNTMWQFYHSGTSWVYTSVTQYNNLQYDNGSALSTLSNGRYVVNWVFRDIGTDQIYIVLGTDNYTKSQAEVSVIPASLPALITSQSILVGRIIVLKNDTSAYLIQSAFDITFSSGSVNTASDITIIDSGNYFTGTDVETALQELGVDKHTHTNKIDLDKIGEDTSGNLTYNGTSVVGGAKAWATATAYTLNQLVTYGGCLYKCVTAHTSSAFNTDIAKWSVVYANIQPWTTGVYYPLNSWMFNGTTLYLCTTAHTATATFDATELGYWSIGGTAVGISSMTYDGATSKFSVTMSNGTVNTYNGIGQNFYEGYKRTDIITSPISSAMVQPLSIDITGQDFIDITAGVAEGFYKSQSIKVSDIVWTKTLSALTQNTALGSTGTIALSGTSILTADNQVYFKVVTAPTTAGNIAGMVVGVSNTLGGTYTSQTAFASGTTATLIINGITITFTLTTGQTFVVGEVYNYITTVDSPTTFLIDGYNGTNNYSAVVHFKGNNKLSIDSLSSNGWTIPQIVSACGYRGQSNNVVALKTNILYSDTTFRSITTGLGGILSINLWDSINNYDYITISYTLCTSSSYASTYHTFSSLIRVSDMLQTVVNGYNLLAMSNTTYYASLYLSGLDKTLMIAHYEYSNYTYIIINSVRGVISGDGKVTLSKSLDSGKYTLTLTNVDGTSTIELPYATLLSGNVAEISGDNTLHITHADNSVTIGEAKEKYDTLFSGTQGSTTATLVSHSVPLASPLTNYRKFGVKFIAYSGTAQKLQYKEFLIEQFTEMLSIGTNATLSCVWGYYNTQDYSDILSTSTVSNLNFNSYSSIVKKIIGIY